MQQDLARESEDNLKVSRSNLRIVLLAALLTIPSVVATPAYGFWFFKHKKNPQNLESSSNDQNNSPTPHVINQSPNAMDRRLVPSYMVNSNSMSQVRKKEVSKSTRNIGPQPTKDDSTNNKYRSISNTIPINSSFAYTKTNIKVAIGLGLQSVKLAIIDGAQLIDNSTGEIITNLPAQSEWILSDQNEYLTLRPDKEFYVALKQLAKSSILAGNTVATNYTSFATVPNAGKNLTIAKISGQKNNASGLPLSVNSSGYTIKAIINQQSQQGLLALNNHLYRGDFLISPANVQNKAANADELNTSFNVINYLDLEDYLLSVVPSEMPSLWPLEALKAQAIAARSYALANLGKHGSAGYDLKDNTEDQVYLGVKSEADSTNEAVNSTKGLVMKYNGKPICAYFHSCSGGSTERAENVWHSAVPYLKAVIDFDQEAPLYNWTKNYSILQTESGLPKDIGQVFSITILAKASSGRATYILVNGSNGSRIISGEAARKYFNLPSTNFNVTPSETAYIFAGKGFGHGLGLSQWGAKSLARYGYNAAQILCYYYDGISIAY